MGKVLKAVVGIAAAVGVAVFAPMLAPALAAALSVSTTVATAIASVGLSLIAGLATAALAGRPSAQDPRPINFRQAITNSFIIIGKRRQGGLMIFFHPRKSGSDHFRYFIFASAGHRCKGVARWYLNDEVVTVDGTGKVTSGKYANAAWLWFGRGSYTTDETPSGWRSETGGKWGTDHVGYGVAKIYAKFQMTDDVVEAGMPTISAEIEGSDEIRDPRTGTTGYTDLAIPAFYWWLALPREEGGFGAADDEIPDDDLLSAWTNICDEDVALAGGGSEKRYTFSSLIETGAPPSQIRQTFVDCIAGSFTFSEGKFLLRPGYWTPPSATLSEDDLAGEIGIDALLEGDVIATEVTGTFVDPAALYKPQPIPTRAVASDDVRQVNYDLAHITSHTRGQRILEIMLRRAQCEKRVSWPMNIAGLDTRAMQTVQLGTARYGLSNYAWVIDSWGLASDFGVTLGVREENSEIYDWSTDDELPQSGTATPDTPEPIPVVVPQSSVSGELSDGSTTYTAAQIRALEDRIAALEPS